MVWVLTARKNWLDRKQPPIFLKGVDPEIVVFSVFTAIIEACTSFSEPYFHCKKNEAIKS